MGKTFLLKNFIDTDIHYLVKKNGIIIDTEDINNSFENLNEFLITLKKDLHEEKRTIVIDEFQRLPSGIWDDISLFHPEGRLIVSGSSFKLVDRVLSDSSPLLGLFYPMKVPLIGHIDILRGLSENMEIRDAIEIAPYARDPWTIPYLTSRDRIHSMVNILNKIVPSLIGEVFTEEHRELSRNYQSIISLVGSGMQDYDRMGKVFHDRGIVSRPSSSSVIPYLRNMERMGLVTSYRVWKSKKTVYRLTSPVMRLYYYLDSRYDLEDRDVPPDEIKPTIDRQRDLAVEEFLAGLIGELSGGRVEIQKDHDKEIDILVSRRNKPYLLGEVKWGKSTKADLDIFREKVEDYSCRKIFISRERIERDDEIEVLFPEDILDMVTGNLKRSP